MTKNVDRNIEIKSRTYPWYSSHYSDSLITKQQIQYYLTDFKYRNEVMDYQITGLENHLSDAITYRTTAIECYKKIATLLNKPLVDKSFELDADVLKVVLGDWKLDTTSHVMTIYVDENKLLFKHNTDTTTSEMYISSKTKLITTGRATYLSLVKDSTTYRLNYQGNNSYVKINK